MQYMFIALLMVMPASVQSTAGVWYARAGADGDGTTTENPIGSTAKLEAVTEAGDIIVLMPDEKPLDGGLALKEGQSLLGLTKDGRLPVLTNTNADRNGGNGIVLAKDNRIWNVRVENTYASGIIGNNVCDAWIQKVEVHGANQSKSDAKRAKEALPDPIPHGGIVFIITRSSVSVANRIVDCAITEAAGVGIACVVVDGADGRLIVDGARVEKGTRVGPFDTGIGGLADGPFSKLHMEITGSNVHGRLSRIGRNVAVIAVAKAKASARIERCHLGEVGQDGVLAAVSRVPATVDVQIRDSVIEKAGQMNIEGTITNRPEFDKERAHASLVAMEVIRCKIHDVGGVKGFEGDGTFPIRSIWMGPSVVDKAAFAPGNYQLTLHNSTVSGERGVALGFGNVGSRYGQGPDQSKIDVLLRKNNIHSNESAAIMISTPHVKVDARDNHWGAAAGLSNDRILLLENTKRSQLDVSQPLPASLSGNE